MRRCVEEGALFGGRWCGDVWAKVRCGGRAGGEMCGGKCAAEGVLVRRCVEEGALLWVRWCGDVWRKVRCGGRGRMGVEGRKFVGAGRGCAAEGACVWVWEGANTLKRGRRCGDV